MKSRYFIPLFLLSALVIMFLYTALMGSSVSWSFHFLKEEYGRGNLIITRLFTVLAGMVIGFLVLPLGFVSRRPSAIWGIILPVLGLTLVVNPWNDEAIPMLMASIPEYCAYIVSCWCFWVMGNHLRHKKQEPQRDRDAHH